MSTSLEKRTQSLLDEVTHVWGALSLDTKLSDIEQHAALMAEPSFWNDQNNAQKISKQHAKLESSVVPWQRIRSKLTEISELAGMDDNTLEAELTTQLDALEADVFALKKVLRFNGPYDEYDAIVSIHAGAGGTDAQDWAAMLLRMYVRWAEQHSMKIDMIDESQGEEAGIKSVTLEISGQHAFGRLKGEHGVHRLVRLSPFNSDSLRQTSFAKAEIMPKVDTPDAVQIDEKDLK